MSAKSTRRRRDRRTRRSRTSRPSDASPRGDPHSPTAQHRLDAALATLQITPARRTATRGRRGSAGPSSTGGRSSRPPRPTSPSTCRSATRPAPRRRCHLSGLLDPTTDSLCRDVLRRIGREGRNRGRGQVAGVGWAQAEAVAARAADSGNLQGVRDAAIILVMSDALARISEVVALQCSDVEPETTTSGGTVHIRASKNRPARGPALRATSGRPRSTRSAATWRCPDTPPARCFAGCCAVATAVANRSARTASGGSFASGLRPCPAVRRASRRALVPGGQRAARVAELQQAGRVALA